VRVITDLENMTLFSQEKRHQPFKYRKGCWKEPIFHGQGR